MFFLGFNEHVTKKDVNIKGIEIMNITIIPIVVILRINKADSMV
jgi:hypothetical protein